MPGPHEEGAASRRDRYTNARRVFLDADDYFYLHVNLDTWYYSAWVQPTSFGTMALGTGPLTAERGAGSFVVQQVAAFQHAFSGLVRPTSVHVWYRPQLEGAYLTAMHFAAPDTLRDLQALEMALEQASYGGITNISLPFDLWATVRNERGELREMWLPDAGQAWYAAHYTEGQVSRPGSVAVTYILTPLAKTGEATWTVELQCNLVSLFRRSNAGVLARVRAHWQEWLQAHPEGVDLSTKEEEQGDAEADLEAGGIVTLAEPPAGTPADNEDLFERNGPRLREAVARWEQAVGHAFEWQVDLDA